jgi:hypothetical protein
LASATQSLQIQLNEGQKAAALRPILAELAQTRDPYALRALAEAAHALPTSLTDEEARAALDPILQAIGHNTEPDALQALVTGVQQLAPELNRRDAATLAEPVIAELRTQRHPETFGALVLAARALTPNFQVQSLVDGSRIARAGLAAATTSTEAIAWATALDTVLATSESSIGSFVEALKYPTAALQNPNPDRQGAVSAEDFLLDQFQALSAKAGINATSLDDILSWIRQHHPEVDLESPPTRPPPIDEFDVVDRSAAVRERRSRDP